MKALALFCSLALFVPITLTSCTPPPPPHGFHGHPRHPSFYGGGHRNAPKMSHARKKYVTGR